MSQVEDGHLEPGPRPPRLPRLLAGVSLKALFVLTAKTTRRICSCQVSSLSLGFPAPPWGPQPLPGVPCSSLGPWPLPGVPRSSLGSPAPPWGPQLLPGVPHSSLGSFTPP